MPTYRIRDNFMERTKPAWIFAPLAIVGFFLTLEAVHTWAPDALLQTPDRTGLVATAKADAEILGCRISSDPRLQVSAGPRLTPTVGELRALVRRVRDPEERRQRMSMAQPLRIGVRFANAVCPNSATGSLLLEYDNNARMVGASFGLGDRPVNASKPLEGEKFARHLARHLLDGPSLPVSRNMEQRGFEWIYRRTLTLPQEQGLVGYVYIANSGSWMVHRQAAEHLVRSEQHFQFWRWPLSVQLQAYVLATVVLIGLGLLLWRLSHQRAGFSQTPMLAFLLLLGLIPVIRHYTAGDLRILVALWCYLLLNQAGVLLAWVVSEAELRELRPGSIEHWDRLTRWKPLAATGLHLIIGVACGSAMAGFLAASGRLAEKLGGGYGSYLVILPDYWSLPSSLNWGLALTALTSLLVASGGRLGGRLGAIFGATLSAAGWSLVTPVAPLGWSFGFALIPALVAGWIVWRYGLLTLTAAAVTAVSLPTAWVAWSSFPLLTESAVLASLPFLLVPLGIVLIQSAPRHGNHGEVEPSYVSNLENQAKLQGEVDLLRSLQLSLLPPTVPRLHHAIDIAWRMTPADSVGGDFLDLVEDDDGRLWMAVADVAGHGIACSVLTAFTKAAVAEHAVAEVDVAQALRRIRRLFRRLRSQRTLVTLLLAVWDPKTRRLSVASAGHPPLLLATQEGVQEVGQPGLPLGNQLQADGTAQTLTVERDAVLVAYSDGVAEATAPDNEPYSYERWPQCLESWWQQPSHTLLQQLLDDVENHRQGRPAEDDVTALVVRLGAPNPEPSAETPDRSTP